MGFTPDKFFFFCHSFFVMYFNETK